MGVVAVSLALAGPARAGTTKLVVVVEGDGGGTKVEAPDDVRRAISEELGQPVLSPSDPAAGEASRVLLVAIGPQRIAMSLRAGDPFQPQAEAISRTVAAPPERNARLERIAWLAGNLVRDQVAAIVDETAMRPSGAPANSGAQTQPPPVTPPEPPRTSAPEPAGSRHTGDADVSRAASPPISVARSGWSVTAAGGMAGAVWTRTGPGLLDFQSYMFPTGAAWQVEVARRATPQSPTFAGVLEMGPDNSGDGLGHVAGAAATVGSTWDRQKWYAEATVGIGVEAVRTTVHTFSATTSSTTGTASMTTVTTTTLPRLYARGTAGIGMPLSPSLDAVTRLTAHVSTESLGDCFLALTIGVRLRLP